MSVNREIAEAQAAKFNARVPIGTPVLAYPGSRTGRCVETRTRSEAQVLNGHTPVVWVEGEPGWISLSHVKVIA